MYDPLYITCVVIHDRANKICVPILRFEGVKMVTLLLTILKKEVVLMRMRVLGLNKLAFIGTIDK